MQKNNKGKLTTLLIIIIGVYCYVNTSSPICSFDTNVIYRTNSNDTCDDYTELSGFHRIAHSSNVKLAFVILAYRDVDHVINLIRMLYTDDTVFCVHLDNKSRAIYHQQLQYFSSCFKNIIVATDTIDVFWAGHGILQVCTINP